jgi:Fe-S oxidoreductase, related to NifB/MoaA family
MAKITGFERGSYGKRNGLKIGDDVVALSSHPLNDILDYLYFDGEERVEVEYIDRRGRRKTVTVEKPMEKSLGLDFSDAFSLAPKRCKNKCLFCFVDQLPKGMRDTLYVKDDDYRMSVVCGNYVTLTNLTDADVDRIIEYHLSPLYVSVHAYDRNVRQKLVSNPNTEKLIGIMEKFKENGIVMHTQVVLCEGINDGEVLKETMRALYAMYPSVKSLAVVPVGLTAHREGLYPLKLLSAECINRTIDDVEAFNDGKQFCWCSDEFYIKVGRKLPKGSYYADYPQIENGVGLVSQFSENVEVALSATDAISMEGERIALITGVSFAGILEGFAKRISEKFNCVIDVFAVKNRFFGESITVAGLIVGGDIMEQVPAGYVKYLLPRNMLREFTDVFLDGVTLSEVERALGGRVYVTEPLGEDLLELITGVKNVK